MYVIGDPLEGTWSRTNEVWYWLIEAIREFPILRPMTADLTFVADHYHDLPADFIEIITVEYPIGEDPPRFNIRRDHTDEDFESDYYYDIDKDYADGTGHLLWMGQVVASDVRINYLAPHDTAAAEGMVLTIPDQYINILEEYCVIRAWTERLSTEIANPTAHASTISQINQAVEYHRKRYQEIIQKAITEMVTSKIVPNRRLDKFDRIY